MFTVSPHLLTLKPPLTNPPDPPSRGPLPPTPAPRPLRGPNSHRTRRNPRRATHLRRRVHANLPLTILLRADHPEDLHLGVLQHRRAVRRVWRGSVAGERVSAAAGE